MTYKRLEDDVTMGHKPWTDLGVEFQRLQAHRFGEDAQVSEKNLGHHFLLGAAALLSAGAKIIYCTRHPGATAWSCFKTRFSTGNGWSYDLNNIKRYQDEYDRLMQHWLTVLPKGSILEVGYEDVIQQPERSIRRLLSDLQLDFEGACLEPHKSKQPVLTASAAQVRQPLYSEANRSFKNYQQFLPPSWQES